VYYDAYWEGEAWETRPSWKLLDLFQKWVSADDRCLDVGCGDGGTSGPWLTSHAGQYVGVDISESAVAAARNRGLDARRVTDARELPFEQGSFDAAICLEVLEHVFQPQQVLEEIRRVLRAGGRVITTVPNVAHWRNRLDLATLGRWNPRGDHLSPSEPWRDPHLRFFTLASLVALVESCGFRILVSGGHARSGLLQHVPGLRNLPRSSLPSPTVRRLTERFPRTLAETLYVVAEVPPS
jgi:methionine biosynthesis protein MetW